MTPRRRAAFSHVHALACMIMQRSAEPGPAPGRASGAGSCRTARRDSRQIPRGVGVALREGALVLADGSVFEGELIGAEAPGGVATGEVVFNTVLSGYQEVITDPSYAGQIIAFTNPHIGNYGVSTADFEARRPFCRGVVVRELARRRSSWRSDGDLDDLLRRYGVSGIAGIDTRRLTRLIRETGALPGAFGDAGEAALRAAAAAEPGTDGIDLVAEVTTSQPYLVSGGGRFRIVAYDLGIKRTILRQLAALGTVEVVPASTSAADVLARAPDGVFLSNGPGDPAEVPYVVGRGRRPAGTGPGVRHLPRPPGHGPRHRRRDRQAALRAPRRQPPRAAPGLRPGGDHQPEPQLRRRRGLPRRPGRGHPRQPERRRLRGDAPAATSRRAACSTTPRPARARTTAGTCSRSSAG